MALTPLHIKKGLSSREISRLLYNSDLTKSDCELLRPLAQKSTLSIDDIATTGASHCVVGSNSVQGGKSSNQGEASANGGEVALNGGVASLPSLRINNSNEGSCEDKTEVFSAAAVPIPSWVRKSEFKVKTEVMALFQQYPIERIGFLTFTFADDVQCHKEATKRLNSLITGVLRERYAQCIRVSERQPSGRWHFHLVVVCQQDIRRGVDFQAIKERRYKDGANSALRAEWAFWRKTSKNYGFGRTELLPIRKTGEALAAYVAKYISKGFAYRQPQDKGMRLYSVIGGSRACSSRFSFYSPVSCLWRQKVAMWAASWSGVFARVALSGGHQPVDSLTYEDLPSFFGSKWAWRYRDEIMAMEYPF
jgi:hypothetical protein